MKTNSYICILKRKRGTPRLKGRKNSFNAREANQFLRNKLQRKGSEPDSAKQASMQEKHRCLKAEKRIRFRLRFTL